MKKGKHCEVFGNLEKLEEFSTIHNNIIPGSLVFESLNPFWGYYHDDPHDSSPVYIYFAVEKNYPAFDVVRAFQHVKAESDFDFDAAKAFVKFNDRSYNVIRIRHLTGYDKIQTIQEGFLKNGIKPLMASGNWRNVKTHVTLHKVFCLHRLSDNILVDSCEINHSYLEIPRKMEFDEFVDVTQKVRNNWFESKFDAALGYYMLEKQIVDFIRIYSGRQDKGYLNDIRKLYLQKMEV